MKTKYELLSSTLELDRVQNKIHYKQINKGTIIIHLQKRM